MHNSKGGIKQNKTISHAQIAGRIKSYEFLTDFVFVTCCEIGERVKVVICSNINRFLEFI